jgi:hypothetical protein
MNGVSQVAVQGKTPRAIFVAYVVGGHELPGRFLLPPTDGARASRP